MNPSGERWTGIRRRGRIAIWTPALMVSACAADVGPLDGDETLCAAGAGRHVGAGLVSPRASGCEVCACGVLGEHSCPNEGCSLTCDPILCRRRTGGVVRWNLTPCGPSNGCGPTLRGVEICVYFSGCNAPEGRCVVDSPQRFNLPVSESAPRSSYCGCDGQTYVGIRPDRPYAHSGDCPAADSPPGR